MSPVRMSLCLHQPETSCVQGRGGFLHLRSSCSTWLPRNPLPSIILPLSFVFRLSLCWFLSPNIWTYSNPGNSALPCHSWSCVCIWLPLLLSFLSQEGILAGALMPRGSSPTSSRHNSTTVLWAPSCSFQLPQEITNTHLFFCQMYFCFKAKEPSNHQTKSHFCHLVWKSNWRRGTHPEDEDPSLTTVAFLKSGNTTLEMGRKDVVVLLCFWFCVLLGVFLSFVLKWEKFWHPALWGEVSCLALLSEVFL